MAQAARTLLLTGGTGQVGTEIRRRAPAGWTVTAPARDALDLGDARALTEAATARPWTAIVNAAAYTAVDRAESDAAAAWAANALAPAALAEAAARSGAPLIQLSTDYVFDGTSGRPYTEEDAVGPLGVYGASKLGGELAVRGAHPRHVILRTSWVYAAHGSNFVRTMLRLGAERPVLRVVDDQRGAPTAAGDIAEAVWTVARRLADDPAAPTGTYHLAGGGETTWCGFAREIFSRAAARGGPSPVVEAIATADYPTAARRPADTRLSTAKLERDYGIAPRPWREALDDVMTELNGAPR